jgi:hypothetical protein
MKSHENVAENSKPSVMLSYVDWYTVSDVSEKRLVPVDRAIVKYLRVDTM